MKNGDLELDHHGRAWTRISTKSMYATKTPVPCRAAQEIKLVPCNNTIASMSHEDTYRAVPRQTKGQIVVRQELKKNETDVELDHHEELGRESARRACTPRIHLYRAVPRKQKEIKLVPYNTKADEPTN